MIGHLTSRSLVPSTRTTVRWVVGIVVILHGLIHLLGAVEGFGWADVSQLKDPVGTAVGVVWLAAAIVVVAAGALLVARVARWWPIGAVAVVVSQMVIITSWADANAGTFANIVLLVAVIHGYASQGPHSARAEYHHRVSTALSGPHAVTVLTDHELEHLPVAVAAYIRQSGAVGQARVTNFAARIHGRIRAGATKPWMTFTGEQVNTYGPEPSRLFFIDATMFGFPVDVLHTFADAAAHMQVRVCSLVTMVDAAGPDLDRAETVTLFNDMCILAPAALADAPISWQDIDDHHVRAAYTNGAQTISAVLTFNDDHELVDFVSDDRLAASPNGKSFTRLTWSTPITGYRNIGSRCVATIGEARWHAPGPDGEFAYLEFHLDDIAYNTTRDTTEGERHLPAGVRQGATP